MLTMLLVYSYPHQRQSVPTYMKVLIYSGQFDLVCHHLGTEKMLDALPWSLSVTMSCNLC